MPNPYATQEPPELLWLEQINNAAVYLGAIAYGITIFIYFMTIHYLRVGKKKGNWIWFIFVTVLFGLATTNIALNIRFTQLVYIDNREYPGGPLMFLIQQQAVPINVAGNAESILITFFADALLIYRCYILYRRWWIIILPILMWLAATVLSGLFVAQAALPGSSLWASGTLDFSVPYFAVVMSLNILLTLLLSGRLYYMHRQMSDALGPQHGRTYTHIATMLVESAIPYAVISFIFIVLYAKKNTTANLFIPLWVQAAATAPMMITLRVARGYAWSDETISEGQLSHMRFNNKVSGGSTTANNRSNGRSGNSNSNGGVSMIEFKAASNPHLGKASEIGTVMSV